MDWLERMNSAISYIEENLTCDIDYKHAARIACCPYYHFQRMFSFIADIPVSEYIRRRRLTLAAFELQQSDMSIIEIALKYGYESHSSFTRAFSELHGIAPVAARKPGTMLKAYPRMTFHISMTGGAEMNYRIEKLAAFEAVGAKYSMSTSQSHSRIPLIWEEIRDNGVADTLFELADKNPGRNPGGVLGICADGDWGRKDEFNYYIAVASGGEPPKGMEKVVFPESQWVVFDSPTMTDITTNWKRLYTEWVPTSVYSLADIPAIESYHPPQHHPQNELWIPITKNTT